MSWTRANHLSLWASKQDARHQFPLLIRKLIKATVPQASVIIPAFEQVGTPGFDGIVNAPVGNQFVPTGSSVWEMGVGENPRSKATKDFEKRTKNTTIEDQKLRTFVFVTPRRWSDKADWEKENGDKFNWKSVKVLDSVDLEHWIEQAPGVDLWFSNLDGRGYSGMQSLASYWKALQAISNPSLLPNIFTVSREEEISAINKWLSAPANSFFLQTDGISDGVDFVAALAEYEDQYDLKNAILVESIEAWHQLSANNEHLILIAAPALQLESTDSAGAVAAGHHVFVSGPNAILPRGGDLILRRLDAYVLADTLEEAGFEEVRANSISRACCGSTSILKRMITIHPETSFPRWAHEDVRSTLAPFALAGGWVNVDPENISADPSLPIKPSPPPLDVWLICQLIGCTNDVLQQYISRWSHEADPLFIHFRKSVLVSSREDVWYLLGGAVTKSQLDIFRDVALLVLTEDDPALDLDREQRWLAALYGKTHSLSKELRRSIVETLALMSTYPTMGIRKNDVVFEETVREIIERALPVNATWQRWASFSSSLTIIAEAEPEIFLKRIEEDLDSDTPQLPELFRQHEDQYFGRSLHCDLLWALEGLAWSPEFLTRVSIVLARLAFYIRGVKTNANRPENSLREILLLWLWHTNANLTQRVKALSAVLNAVPETGWEILKSLMPGMSGTTMTTHMPRWRPWALGWSRDKITRKDVVNYQDAFTDVVILAAGKDLGRWAEIFGGRFNFNNTNQQKLISALNDVVVGADENSETAFALWSALRKMIRRHEKYCEANWALEESILKELRSTRDSLRPTDPVLANNWLFDMQAELDDPDPMKDHVAHDKALHAARTTALSTIFTEQGLEGLHRLLDRAGSPNVIGWICGQEKLMDIYEAGLPKVLENQELKLSRFIRGYVAGAFAKEGWDFINSLPLANWSKPQIGILAQILPYDRKVWKWISAFGNEASSEYWRRVYQHLHEPTVQDLLVVSAELLKVGRPLHAIEQVHGGIVRKLKLPSDFIAEVLEGALHIRDNDNLPDRNISYEVQQLVALLQQDHTFDRLRLARIEWGFLPLIEAGFSEVGPDTLVNAVISEPSFFIDLLKLIYFAENEKSEANPLEENEQLQAMRARELLDGLDKLPGTKEDETVDFEFLNNWIIQVRKLASENNRLSVCDLAIGRIIALDWRKGGTQSWRLPQLAQMMQSFGSEHIFRGFVTGVINSRGVTTRMPFDGGKQEHSLAKHFRQLSEDVAASSPKLAHAFISLAEYYKRDAEEEDQIAERERLRR